MTIVGFSPGYLLESKLHSDGISHLYINHRIYNGNGNVIALKYTLKPSDILLCYDLYNDHNSELWMHRWNDTTGTIGNKNYDIITKFVRHCIEQYIWNNNF